MDVGGYEPVSTPAVESSASSSAVQDHSARDAALAHDDKKHAHADDATLAQTAVALFGGGDPVMQQAMVVNVRVAMNRSDMTVTYRDAVSGRILTQVSPDIMSRLAQFFDKHSGGLVDRNA